MDETEVRDLRHENRMKELEYSRESDKIKCDMLWGLEKQKHEWKLQLNELVLDNQKEIILLKSKAIRNASKG